MYRNQGVSRIQESSLSDLHDCLLALQGFNTYRQDRSGDQKRLWRYCKHICICEVLSICFCMFRVFERLYRLFNLKMLFKIREQVQLYLRYQHLSDFGLHSLFSSMNSLNVLIPPSGVYFQLHVATLIHAIVVFFHHLVTKM